MYTNVHFRGVASTSIRSLAIAGDCLVSLREQEEVLQILERIRTETGWRIEVLATELKKKWGWDDGSYDPKQHPPRQMPMSMVSSTQMHSYQYQDQSSSLPPAPPTMTASQNIPKGIINPLMKTADFNAPTHPYQNYYVAPNQHQQSHYLY